MNFTYQYLLVLEAMEELDIEKWQRLDHKYIDRLNKFQILLRIDKCLQQKGKEHLHYIL